MSAFAYPTGLRRQARVCKSNWHDTCVDAGRGSGVAQTGDADDTGTDHDPAAVAASGPGQSERSSPPVAPAATAAREGLTRLDRAARLVDAGSQAWTGVGCAR